MEDIHCGTARKALRDSQREPPEAPVVLRRISRIGETLFHQRSGTYEEPSAFRGAQPQWPVLRLSEGVNVEKHS